MKTPLLWLALAFWEDVMGKDNAQKQKMDFKTWLDNFWYYYKTPTILITVFVLALLVVVLNLGDIGASDYSVAVISKEAISEETVTNLQKKVYEHAADYTGDSFVGVEIHTVEATGASVDFASSEELSTILNDGKTYLFFLDDAAYDYLKDKVEFCPLDEIISDQNLSGDRWYVKGSEFAAGYDIDANIPDDLSVSVIKPASGEGEEDLSLGRYYQILLARMILNVVVQTYNY